MRRADERRSCLAPGQATQRVPCICGGRYFVHVVVEYLDPSGRVDYAGGRFCYVKDALMDIGLPADALPVQVTIYDWHEPDEIIRVTFTHRRRMSPDGGEASPEKAGDDEQGAYIA